MTPRRKPLDHADGSGNCGYLYTGNLYKRNRRAMIWYQKMAINSYLKSKTTANTQQEEKLEAD